MADFSTDSSRLGPRRTARLYGALLLLAAAIWGLGTVVIKGTVDEFPALWLVGIRFLSAGIIFCTLFAPRLARLARAVAWPTTGARDCSSARSSAAPTCSTPAASRPPPPRAARF